MKEITRIEEWKALLTDSHTHPVIVFKHSATCPISRQAHEEMELLENKKTTTDIHKVVVQNHRDISNIIADDLQVKHESPQVFIVYKGKAHYHESHYGITALGVEKEYTELPQGE